MPLEVSIVGCGVSGLTCGIRLREAGFQTTIVTRELPPATTSAVAAAVWFPFRAYPFERVVRWSRESREVFESLARDEPASGVSLTRLIDLRSAPDTDPWWRSAVGDYRHARPDELPPGYADGHVARVPLIETPIYLRYLEDRFRRLGGTIDLRPEGVASLAELAAGDRLIVHCAGLGARQLAEDPEVFPTRGQVVRVANPGLDRCLTDEAGPRALAYVVPRSHDCVLGGTADALPGNDPASWDLTPDPAVTRAILAKAGELEPRLRGATVQAVAVGLRPSRSSVRLELDPVARVLHNYGHGGAGFTVSWGCAAEVTQLVRAFAAR